MAKKRDILIRVYGRTDPAAAYPVDAELDDGSYFFGGELQIQDRELLKLALDIPAYGAKLGQYLFTAPVQRAIEKAYATVDGDPKSQLRVRLCFYPDAWELHAYPWERMLVPWQSTHIPIAASPLIPFSRFIQLPEGQQGPVEDRPIRLLLAVANPLPASMPRGLQEIAVEDELRGLVQAMVKVDDLKVSVLPGRTALSDAFKNELQAAGILLINGSTELNRLVNLAGQHDAVHILCHGMYDSGTATLCLEGEDGRFVGAQDLSIKDLFAGLAAKPRLVYLSACEAAKQDMDDLTAVALQPRQPHPMVGLAPRLVQAGVPAVVAMQDLIQVDIAHKLAAEFYSRLLEYGEVDRALSEARLNVIDKTSKEWAIPALFLRLREGRLFATDPAREALDQTLLLYPEKFDGLYLPLDAVALKTSQLIQDWERASQQGPTLTDLWTLMQPFQTGLTVVIGDAGSGKSTLLQRLARASAQSPVSVEGHRTVPLLIDLRNYVSVRNFTENRVERLIFDAFHQLVPSLSEDRFREMLRADSVRFRFLLDHGDELPDRVRRQALDEANQLVAVYAQHQFVIALDCRSFRPWDQIDRLLVIAPLSARKVARFLESDPVQSPNDPKPRLLSAIRKAELFEFAAVPWLLLHMLDQVKQKVYPRSRIRVLKDWLQSAMYSVADDGGRSYRAGDSLCALAWNLQSARRQSLALEEAFTVLDRVRGQRDYNLEELLDLLVRSGILVRSGDESIRFAYPALQAFGAAMHLQNDPDQGRLIEEIVATLGQPSRVRWWQPTLALLAGMLDDPAPLIRSLVFGASMMQGEQIFVASLCLLEFARERGTDLAPSRPQPGSELDGLRQQICAALLWRSKRSNENDVSHRQRAVEFLGFFRRQESIPLLVSLAIDRVRVLEGREPEFEYSQVRFAAIRSLRLMQDVLTPDLIARYAGASKLIESWSTGDIASLTSLLRSTDVGIQGIAAFALGDLQNADGARELFSAFRNSATDPATLWAITDALQALDPADVITQVVQPMIDEARKAALPPVEDKYERLLYLIGQLRIREQAVIDFLDWYLEHPVPKIFKGRSLVSLGKLHVRQEPDEQDWWRDLVKGRLDSISPAQNSDRIYLRRKAIEALGEIGDLQLLYSTQQNQDWMPELDEALFRAGEACMAFPGVKLIIPITPNTGEKSNGSK